MGHDRRHRDLRRHIESVRRRPQGEMDRIVGALTTRVWPGGDDRALPAAAEWLRRWGPSRAGVLPLACGCAQGACGVCN